MWLEAVTELLAILIVGRLCLSMLPPGWPGYHDLREGGATVGASLMLGSLGWTLMPLWLPWLVLGGLRWLLLPGAMRPRHELAIEPSPLAGRLVLAAALVAVGWAAWSSPEGSRDHRALVGPAQALAAALVLLALLVRLRVKPVKRIAVFVACAAAIALLLSIVPCRTATPWLLGGSWVLAGGWIRRRTADRRAGWLALLGLASAIVLSTWRVPG